MENRETPIKDNKYRSNIIKNIFYAIGAAVITGLLVYLLMRAIFNKIYAPQSEVWRTASQASERSLSNI